ncbi:hypothetical protein HMPREF9080_01331 [Cardiobacterium valvarum F0432]|uniref:EamA domain-containing protein n=1 Tax=Cardiobacterium valvarum F0432 TaxID=797473 RepID=G9ZEZ1_9GAMM|nr:hypothetical protein HMPREF9080_01331 [Cardiobacterium valvarum F0432]
MVFHPEPAKNGSAHRPSRHERHLTMTRFSIILTTALAPLLWGSTYLVTAEFLPPQRAMGKHR